MFRIAGFVFGGLMLAATTTAAMADYWENRARIRCEQRGRDYSYWRGRCIRARPFYRDRRRREDCGPGAFYACGVRGCGCRTDPDYPYETMN